MNGFDTLKEIFLFLITRKKWWLIPVILTLMLFGLILLSTGSGLAPFIYTLF
jgi:hypothetical protein